MLDLLMLFVMFGGRVFTGRLVSLFVRGRFHTEAFQEKRKEASPIL
jgi:hypothetical protein